MRSLNPVNFTLIIQKWIHALNDCSYIPGTQQQIFNQYLTFKCYRVLSYEDNHPLSQLPVELDALLNTALWFLEHTNHSI